MIKYINIPNFGSFKDFVWRNCLREGGNILEFKRLNILYGRNYSGKTTLSRILQSFENNKLPDNHDKASFEVATDDNNFTQTDITNHGLDVRVYNRDFVDDNLSFLRDHEGGEINTFAIIGSQNKELEKQIANKEAKLGSIETETGLKCKHAQKVSELSAKRSEANSAKGHLEERLRRRANDVIKHNRVYGHPGYNLRAIQQDINTIRANSIAIFDEEEVTARNELLKEVNLPDIVKKLSFTPRIKALHEKVRTL